MDLNPSEFLSFAVCYLSLLGAPHEMVFAHILGVTFLDEIRFSTVNAEILCKYPGCVEVSQMTNVPHLALMKARKMVQHGSITLRFLYLQTSGRLSTLVILWER